MQMVTGLKYSSVVSGDFSKVSLALLFAHFGRSFNRRKPGTKVLMICFSLSSVCICEGKTEVRGKKMWVLCYSIMYAHRSPNPVIFNPWAPSPYSLLSHSSPEGNLRWWDAFHWWLTHPAARHTLRRHCRTHSARLRETVLPNRWMDSCYVTWRFSASPNPGKLGQRDRSHYLSLTSQMSYLAHTHTRLFPGYSFII